jgi:hypothetical protein
MPVIPAFGRLRGEESRVHSQPELHSETLSQKKKKKVKDSRTLILNTQFHSRKIKCSKN